MRKAIVVARFGSRQLGSLCRRRNFAKRLHLPRPAESRQALFADEQFLHGALFEVVFLGNELLQGFDEGIRIGQHPGNGFLFDFGGRKSKRAGKDIVLPKIRLFYSVIKSKVVRVSIKLIGEKFPVDMQRPDCTYPLVYSVTFITIHKEASRNRSAVRDIAHDHQNLPF